MVRFLRDSRHSVRVTCKHKHRLRLKKLLVCCVVQHLDKLLRQLKCNKHKLSSKRLPLKWLLRLAVHMTQQQLDKHRWLVNSLWLSKLNRQASWQLRNSRLLEHNTLRLLSRALASVCSNRNYNFVRHRVTHRLNCSLQTSKQDSQDNRHNFKHRPELREHSLQLNRQHNRQSFRCNLSSSSTL